MATEYERASAYILKTGRWAGQPLSGIPHEYLLARREAFRRLRGIEGVSDLDPLPPRVLGIPGATRSDRDGFAIWRFLRLAKLDLGEGRSDTDWTAGLR
jgi:hypothetical protein